MKNVLERIVTDKFRIILALAGTVSLAVGACAPTQDNLPLPTAEEVEAHYHYEGDLEARISGNVAEITVTQSASQLRRGGTLWAKVGPYILLFSEETFQLFENYPGLAAVRVITKVKDGPEVARALLARDALSGVQWRRSLNIAGKARRDGTRHPSLLEDLVRWGEDHTEFEYNPRYTSRR
ncbi:MAG: hypothetical protein ACE5GJ_02535 [Gemmatimonadota bacterium]